MVWVAVVVVGVVTVEVSVVVDLAVVVLVTVVVSVTVVVDVELEEVVALVLLNVYASPPQIETGEEVDPTTRPNWVIWMFATRGM